MFPSRFYPERFFPGRYFPHVGADAQVVTTAPPYAILAHLKRGPDVEATLKRGPDVEVSLP